MRWWGSLVPMNDSSDIPTLIQEFIQLAKDYLRQRTIEPAKRLGRYFAFALGAGISFAVAGLFFSIAILRVITRSLPTGPYWSALAYGLTVLVVVATIGVVVWRTRVSEGTRV